jgi:hypothetical protein
MAKIAVKRGVGGGGGGFVLRRRGGMVAPGCVVLRRVAGGSNAKVAKARRARRRGRGGTAVLASGFVLHVSQGLHGVAARCMGLQPGRRRWWFAPRPGLLRFDCAHRRPRPLGGRARGRCWRPWEREWRVARAWCLHIGGRWCAPARGLSSETRLLVRFRGFFLVWGGARGASRVRIRMQEGEWRAGVAGVSILV